MKEQDTGVMEGQILSAENAPGEDKQKISDGKNHKRKFKLPSITNPFPKLINLALILKKPKALIILALLLTAIISLISIISLSKKPQNQPQIKIPERIKPSPTPTVDQTAEEIKRQVEEFNKDLESLDSGLDKLPFPQVDLKIEF